MGNRQQSHSSSVFVENTCLNSQPRSQPNSHRHYSAEKIDNYQRRFISTDNRFSADMVKSKQIISSKILKEEGREIHEKQRNLSYYPLENVEKKIQENDLKFKQKVKKKPQKSVSNQKITKIQLIRLEKRNNKLTQSNEKHLKSSDKFCQPAILSPQNGLKRRFKGIKQNSLNRNTLSPKNIVKQNRQINIDHPYLQKRISPNQMKKSRKYKIKIQNIQIKKLKSSKNKNKATSVHEVYFSRGSQKQDAIKQSNKKNPAECKIDQNIYIPLQSHKNPIGRNKLVATQRKRQKYQNVLQPKENKRKLLIQHRQKEPISMKSSLRYSQDQYLKEGSGCKQKTEEQENKLMFKIQQLRKENETSMILKDKEYSICSNSMHNLSKMSLKEVQSQIKLQLQPNAGHRNTTVFLIDESIIIRGRTQVI